jgi:hypothetical protein
MNKEIQGKRTKWRIQESISVINGIERGTLVSKFKKAQINSKGSIN